MKHVIFAWFSYTLSKGGAGFTAGRMTVIQRKVDELGRVVIPIEMRDVLGMTAKTPVSITLDGDTIKIRKAEQTCKICGSSEKLNRVMDVCASCIEKIKQL